jgi:hypothetical protein
MNNTTPAAAASSKNHLRELPEPPDEADGRLPDPLERLFAMALNESSKTYSG